MRELYGQFIAYARAYSDAIPTYTGVDQHLVGVSGATGSALAYLCSAITHGAAQARAPLVVAPASPSKFATPADPSNPQKFLTAYDPICPEWDRLLNQFFADSVGWQRLDAAIPASEWSPEQRATVEAVLPVMNKFADDLEDIGRKSEDPTLQDFAVFAAQYRRAYTAALPSYTAADSYLSGASVEMASAINDACKAVGG